MMTWTPLLSFPLEWAALSLLLAGCLYWERSGLTGLGMEGCVLAAMTGLILGYEWTGGYGTACAIGAGFGLGFAVLAAGALLALRTDPAVGAFSLSLVPACALTLLTRSETYRLLSEMPPPGLIRGTTLDGTVAEDLLLSPWFVAAPFVILLAALVLLRTPFGLRLRAYGETPSLAAQEHARPGAYRIAGAAIGAACAVPAAAILLRAHPGVPPLGLGLIALGCAIAGRWSFVAGILLAAGPALLRSARPYAGGAVTAQVALDAAPFLLALLYLILLSRRSLRLATPRESRLDPDLM